MAEYPIVIVAHIAATSKENRDKILDELNNGMNFLKSEKGLLKLGVCLPDNSPPATTQDDTSIYLIEEYANKAAFDEHNESKMVKDFFAKVRDPNAPLMGPDSKVYIVAWLPGYLSRNERLPSQASEHFDLRGRVEHPYVLWATINDPQPKDTAALASYGEAIVKYATGNEPDTIFYADGKPMDIETGKVSDDLPDGGGFICAVEVYASKEACEKHLKDDSVKNLAVQGHKLGSKFVITPLHMVAGFLTRE